jgi:hypothetical protein
VCVMVMPEPSSVLLSLLAAILLTGALIATPFSALAQQQPQNMTTATTTQVQSSSPQSESMEENNKALVTSFIEEVFNQHNLSAVDKYYAQDLIQHSPNARNGSEGFKQQFGPFFKAFPDSHITIEHDC